MPTQGHAWNDEHYTPCDFIAFLSLRWATNDLDDVHVNDEEFQMITDHVPNCEKCQREIFESGQLRIGLEAYKKMLKSERSHD